MNIPLILICLAVAGGGGLMLLMSALNGLAMVDKLYNGAPNFRPTLR